MRRGRAIKAVPAERPLVGHLSVPNSQRTYSCGADNLLLRQGHAGLVCGGVARLTGKFQREMAVTRIGPMHRAASFLRVGCPSMPRCTNSASKVGPTSTDNRLPRVFMVMAWTSGGLKAIADPCAIGGNHAVGYLGNGLSRWFYPPAKDGIAPLYDCHGAGPTP